MEESKKTKIAYFLYAIVGILAIVSIVFLVKGRMNTRNILKSDKVLIEDGKWEGVYIHMHDMSSYTSEQFLDFRGLRVAITDGNADSFEKLGKYMEVILHNNDPLEVYVEIDPYKLWLDAGKNETRYDKRLYESFFEYIATYTESTFEITLSYPYVEYWSDYSKTDISNIEDVYKEFVERLDAYSNVYTYFPGHEEWLIVNSNNYVSDYDTVEDVTIKLFCNMYCDRNCVITAKDIPDAFDDIRNYAGNDVYGLYSRVSMENADIVFLGDSLFDYYRTCFSTPNVVASLTGARTYNIAEGGTTASGKVEDAWLFSNVTDALISNSVSENFSDKTFYEDMKAWTEDNHGGRDVYFVILYGINDYLEGREIINAKNDKDIKTLTGSMRTNIAKLREAFPKAQILWVVPYQVSFFNGRISPYAVGNTGYGYGEYINAEYAVLEEMGVEYVDFYRSDEAFWDYDGGLMVPDGVHPSEQGAFVIAKHIISSLGKMSK